MSAIACPPREQLEAYASGRLSQDQADRLADHLDDCSSCETEIQQIERTPDQFLAHLRLAPAADPLQQEPQCRQMLRLLRAPSLEKAVAAPVPQTPDSPASLPSSFREYRLLQKLGEGGMGAVYKALHAKLNKLVAIKLLTPDFAHHPNRIARFEREMQAVGKLDHPHIVRAMDAGQVEDRHFLAMEFVDGPNLSEVLLHTGPLRIADACEIVRQAALGLRCADEHGLVHRDIKPSNLMLTADGQIKILDLGLAMFEADESKADDTTALGQVVGTPEYIAPEQVSSSHCVDIRADIYSLGCTLYKLLTGQAPFAGPRYKGNFEKMTAHVNDPVPPIRSLRADVPEKLADVLDRMLVKDRDLRFPTPGRVIAAIESFCAGSDLVGLFNRARTDPLAKSGAPMSPTAAHGPMPPVLPASTGQTGRGRRPHAPPPTPTSAQRGKPMVAASSNNATQPAFDPYHVWLGIAPKDQPPNHYRLLGIDLFESNPSVLRDAVQRQMAHVRSYQLGSDRDVSQRILNELGAAAAVLRDPTRKAAYDAKLQQQLQAKAASQAPPPQTPDREAGAAVALPRPASKAARWKPPVVQIALGAAAAAALVFAAIMIYVTTNKGTVKIELPDPTANVQVNIDGNQIDIAGLKDPLRLTVGPHNLKVTSGDFQPFTTEFTIRRGSEEHVNVTLEPKAKLANNVPTKVEPEPAPPAAKVPEPVAVPPPTPPPLITTPNLSNSEISDTGMPPASSPQRLPDKDGFVSLFDGKTLNGWIAGGDAAWSVSDGAIHGQGKTNSLRRSWLLTRTIFRDFVLRADVRINATGNSGIMLRADTAGSPVGYEVEIVGNNYPSAAKTGDIVASKVFHKNQIEDDVWFNLEITARGNHISVSLNGKPISDFTDAKNTHQSGLIGLQAIHADTRVDFRNIQLKPLDDGEKIELGQASTHFNRGHASDASVKEQLEQAIAKALAAKSGRAQKDALVALYLDTEDPDDELPQGHVGYRCYQPPSGGYSGEHDVRLRVPYTQFERVTAGEVRIQLDPGPPYATVNRTVSLSQGGVTNLGRVVLPKVKADGTVSIAGVVKDANGHPVAGAVVRCEKGTATTGADGSYSLQGFGLEVVTIEPFKEGYFGEKARVSIRDMNNRNIKQDLVLCRPWHVLLRFAVSKDNGDRLAGPDVEEGRLDVTVNSASFTLHNDDLPYPTFNELAKSVHFRISLFKSRPVLQTSVGPMFYKEAPRSAKFESIERIEPISQNELFSHQRCPELRTGMVILIKTPAQMPPGAYALKVLVEKIEPVTPEKSPTADNRDPQVDPGGGGGARTSAILAAMSEPVNTQKSSPSLSYKK